MAAVLHNMHLVHRSPGEHQPAATMKTSPSSPQLLPPELLLKTATLIVLAEDLQNMRLVNQAFSNAATTVLQDRFFRIYLMPTRPSMARFTKLTQNKLIALRITQIVVLYRPPGAVEASSVPPTCQAIAEHYGMPWQKVKDIMLE